jgi:pilus assembly protein CpaF
MSASAHAPLNPPATGPSTGSDSRPAAVPRPDAPRAQYIQLKANVHRKLLNRLNLEALASVDRQRAETEIRTLVFELMAEEATPVSMAERETILSDILDEVFGLGPLEPLLRTPTSTTSWSTPTSRCNRAPGSFRRSPRRSRTTATCCASSTGSCRPSAAVDDSSPMVDARLADGSRVNAIIPPLAVDGRCSQSPFPEGA